MLVPEQPSARMLCALLGFSILQLVFAIAAHALISTLEEFRHYIDGLEVYVDTDHQNITWLSRTKGRTDRLGRWILRLSEFRAKIAWRKGKYMDIADCMSRNPQPLDAAEDEDSSSATQSVPQVHMLVSPLRWRGMSSGRRN